MNLQASQAQPSAPAAGLCLPQLDPEIPAQLAKDSARNAVLARFARAAGHSGVRLPRGEFATIEQVVAAQWNQWLRRQPCVELMDRLAGTPVIEVDAARLHVVIRAEQRLNAYQLKAIVEALEQQARGLGWFVQGVLARASSHALPIYDMGTVCTLLESAHADLQEFSDAAYARALLLQEGREVPDTEPVPAEEIAALRTQYGFWPSDLLAEVDGHAHLLDQGSLPAVPTPPRLNVRAAGAWVHANESHPLAPLVRAAVQLQRSFSRDRRRSFLWDGSADDSDPLGALCFLAWDRPHLLFEAVRHLEEYQYNGGQAVEAFARHSVSLAQASDRQLLTLARETKAYLQRWVRLAQLLSHFPVWDGDAD